MVVETAVASPLVKPEKPDFTIERQFVKNNSWMKPRLADALKVYGYPKGIKTTLLKKEVHERHAGWLSDRYIAAFLKSYNACNDKIRSANVGQCQLNLPEIPELTQQEYARTHVRFFTILFQVTDLDIELIMNSVCSMNNLLKKSFEKTSVNCLGTVEVEPVSIPLLETLQTARLSHALLAALNSSTDQYEQQKLLSDHFAKTSRKLEVLRILYTGFQSPIFSGDYCQMLVHFHGVLITNNKNNFEKLRKKLKLNPEFNKSNYQIEIKKLTETPWGEKYKTPLENLHCIANYVTKAAPSRTKNDEADYKFKVKFEHGYAATKEKLDALSDIDQQVIYAANLNLSSKEFRIDLSNEEIFVLADTVNRLMNLKTLRKGYLFRNGDWPEPVK